MVTPDHPLFDVQTLHACASPEALVEASVAGVDEAVALAAAIRRVVGRDLEEVLATDADDRPRCLRVRVPSLTLDQALAVSRCLSVHPGDRATAAPRTTWRIAPAPPRVWLAARDAGRLVDDPLIAPAATAHRWTALDRDVAWAPTVRLLRPTDPDVVALAGELAASLDDVREGALPADGARVTLARSDGRVGLRLQLALPADLAHAAWSAIAAVIAARASHPGVRVAPEATWDDRIGLTFDLSLLVLPAPGVPVGAPPWTRWLDPGPLCGEIAIDVVVPDEHAAAAGAHLAACALDLQPDDAAWIDAPNGDDAPPPADRPPRPTVGGWAASWRATTLLRAPTLPWRWRVRPTLPVGAEPFADDIEVDAHAGDHRWFVRVHDALADHDLIERVTPRPADALDRVLVDRLVDRLEQRDAIPLASAGDRWLQPVLDSGGRRGLALLFDGQAHQRPARWDALLAALDLDSPDLEPWATVGWTATTVRVHLWRTVDPTSAPSTRAWTAA